MKFKFTECPTHLTMIEYISSKNAFSAIQNCEKPFFYEIPLKDLGWPTADNLLNLVAKTENEIGYLEGWRKSNSESSMYKGFSLTYNPDFIDSKRSIYFQSMGAYQLEQTFSKSLSVAPFEQVKNSYYDTYAFRRKAPIVKNNFYGFFSKINFSISRSRVGYLYAGEDSLREKVNFHKDEFPNQLLRINIPLQTSEEYVLEIKSEDENSSDMGFVKHLKKEHAYIWNTRIPHKVYCLESQPKVKVRVHMVLGLIPWFHFNDQENEIISNNFYDKNITSLIENYSFIK